MFFNNIRIQIAAILFLAVLMLFYNKNKKLSLLSARWFRAILVATCINMTFDIITVYTVTHINTVLSWLNDLCHRIFIGSINCTVMFLYFYISTLGKKERRHKGGELFVRLIPAIIAWIVISFGKIEYYISDTVCYSYGITVNVVYVSCAIYATWALIDVYRYRKTLTAERISGIIVGMTIWIGATIVQVLFPGILLTGIAIVLLVFVIYLSFENPKELINVNNGCFNEIAYHKMQNEIFADNQPCYVISVVVTEYTIVQNNVSKVAAENMVAEVAEYIRKKTKLDVFNIHDNMLVMFARKEYDEVKVIVEKLLDGYNRECECKCVLCDIKPVMK